MYTHALIVKYSTCKAHVHRKLLQCTERIRSRWCKILKSDMFSGLIRQLLTRCRKKKRKKQKKAEQENTGDLFSEHDCPSWLFYWEYLTWVNW